MSNLIEKFNSLKNIKFILKSHYQIQYIRAQTQEAEDPSYLTLLFALYVFCFASLFFTPVLSDISHKLFIYLVIPLLLAPVEFGKINFGLISLLLPIKISLYNPLRNGLLCRSYLFAAVVIYGLNKATLSFLLPSPDFLYLKLWLITWLIPLLFFICATIRLCVDAPNFYFNLFRWLGPTAAVNALVNVYFYLTKISGLSAIPETRLDTVLGAAFGQVSTMDSLTYALFLTGSAIALFKNFSKLNAWLLAPTLVILSLTLIIEQSRGTFLATLISLSVFSILSTKFVRRLALLLAILLIGVFASIPKIRDHALSRGDNHRFEVWSRFYELMKQNLIFGYGDRTAVTVVLSDEEKIFQGHNIFLNAQLRGGLIGLTSLLFIFIYGLSRSYKFYKIFDNPTPLCLLMIVTIAGQVDFDIVIWQFGWEWATFWFALSLALGADQSIRVKSR